VDDTQAGPATRSRAMSPLFNATFACLGIGEPIPIPLHNRVRTDASHDREIDGGAFSMGANRAFCAGFSDHLIAFLKIEAERNGFEPYEGLTRTSRTTALSPRLRVVGKYICWPLLEGDVDAAKKAQVH
jgi:hypothetical protein